MVLSWGGEVVLSPRTGPQPSRRTGPPPPPPHGGGGVTSNASWDRSHGQGKVVLCWGGGGPVKGGRVGGDIHPPPGQDQYLPHPPPPPRTGPPPPPIRELRSMRGRYASYWNAFLSFKIFETLGKLKEMWSLGSGAPCASLDPPLLCVLCF